jgi:hypothetical protein
MLPNLWAIWKLYYVELVFWGGLFGAVLKTDCLKGGNFGGAITVKRVVHSHPPEVRLTCLRPGETV